jgi:hypothetical protein
LNLLTHVSSPLLLEEQPEGFVPECKDLVPDASLDNVDRSSVASGLVDVIDQL